MGKGAVLAISHKQKINTKSSTKSELVAADDTISHLLQTKHFLEAQGYPSQQTILYQDNTSAILLECNGRSSAGKLLRHIHIWYYFIKGQIQNKNLEIQYCPTNNLIADYMRKPLQGAKFYCFRKSILNLWASNHPLHNRSVLELKFNQTNQTEFQDPKQHMTAHHLPSIEHYTLQERKNS